MALADLASLQAGQLTVGVIPTSLHTLVPSAVAAFNARYPKIQVVLRELLAPEIEALLLQEADPAPLALAIAATILALMTWVSPLL